MEAKLRNGKCLLWPLNRAHADETQLPSINNGYLTRTIPSEDMGCIARTAISAGLDSMVLHTIQNTQPNRIWPGKTRDGPFYACQSSLTS